MGSTPLKTITGGANANVRAIDTDCSAILLAQINLHHFEIMPIKLSGDAPTVFIRRSAFERVGLMRQQIDEALGLTDEEFRVEGQLVAIGPLVGESALTELIETFEKLGLVYYDDFFEMSGNWPAWLKLFAMAEPASPT